MHRYQLSKPVPTINFFEGFENELDGIRLENTAKPSSISVARVNNFSSLSQLLEEIAVDEYEIRLMNEQIKIQPKSSIV